MLIFQGCRESKSNPPVLELQQWSREAVGCHSGPSLLHQGSAHRRTIGCIDTRATWDDETKTDDVPKNVDLEKKKCLLRKVFKKCQNKDVKFINIKSGNEICQLFDSLKCAIDRVIFETHPLTSRWCFQVASGSSMQSGFRAFRRVAPWRYGKKHVDVSHKQKWWGHLEWKPLNNQPPYRPYITWVCVGYIPFKRAPWRLGGLNS